MRTVITFGIIVLFLFSFVSYVSADPPSGFDWRDNDGDWVTSVKNQGSCGSCWAFSVIGAIESVFNIRENDPNLDLDLAEEEIVTDCLPNHDCCGGSTLSALNYIFNNDIIVESSFPYADSGCTCPGLQGSCTCTYSDPNKCSNYTCSEKGSGTEYGIKVTNSVANDIPTIKQAIIDKGPLSVCMGFDPIVYGTYFDDTGPGGTCVMRCTTDIGTSHCIILVGYEDTGTGPYDGYWILKNSYGASWNPLWNSCEIPGQEGYFRVGYGECAIESNVRYANTKGELGMLCDVDNPCTPGLECEGSQNNPSRCGENPTSDTWIGGGDTNGCGTDPDSDYWDYYLNQYGNEYHEITNTKNCDLEDDCAPPEITDWFVAEITDTCDFNSWNESDPNAPTLLTPADNLDYEVCDFLHFTWTPGEGSDNTYYFNAELDGVPFSLATDLEWIGTEILQYPGLPPEFVEDELDDGTWEWWVCNGPSYQCSEHFTIIKETKPTLLTPPNYSVLTPSTELTWSEVNYAKNYVAKIKGPAFNFPPYWAFYMSLKNTQSFQMDSWIYNFLLPGTYTWTVAAVCNTNPSISEMLKYEYADPRHFIK